MVNASCKTACASYRGKSDAPNNTNVVNMLITLIDDRPCTVSKLYANVSHW